MNYKLVFFGSTEDSVIVADYIHTHGYPITAVVTQLPRPVGRKQIITPTPVEVWAKKQTISVLTFPNSTAQPWKFEHNDDVVNSLITFTPDILISASFGQQIPWELIKKTKHGGLNVHPSLLPRWNGADPLPWTILSGDAQTGVTIVTLSEKFDKGKILGLKKIPVKKTDSPDSLQTELFTLGAELLVSLLPDYLSGKNIGTFQNPQNATVSKKLSRDDGYIPWELIEKAMEGVDVPNDKRTKILSFTICHLPFAITRAVRALSPWPGVWTKINLTNPTNETNPTNGNRMKILEAHVEKEQLVLDTVQLEGKTPVKWNAIYSKQ